MKVAEVEPGGIPTESGTTALSLLDERSMLIPSEGTGPFKVTVPVEETPAGTLVGESFKPNSEGGVTVMSTSFETSPKLAVIVATSLESTGVVFTVNVAEV